jgi:hypothetical protein
MRPLSQQPLYAPIVAAYPASDYKPLGGGPATYRTIPRSQTPIDARTLGYVCPTVQIDMQIARREGDEGGKPPAEVPKQEQR